MFVKLGCHCIVSLRCDLGLLLLYLLRSGLFFVHVKDKLDGFDKYIYRPVLGDETGASETREKISSYVSQPRGLDASRPLHRFEPRPIRGAVNASS